MGRYLLVAALALLPATARAGGGVCRIVDVDFTPGSVVQRHAPQIVGWIETPAGAFEGTIFITRETGTFGLGNRPGRFDFNSGPGWPYGRRITTFPVWAHRHGLSFPQIVFQNGDDSALSHPSLDSTIEKHYCQPLDPTTPQWDAITCATPKVSTDKGTFSATATTGYPPRADIARIVQPGIGVDSVSVDQYKMLNPFDAVSAATPTVEQPAHVTYSLPDSIADGDHVLWLEVSLMNDMNATYNATVFPPPTNIGYEDYGEPYRGQPSVLYRVPFTVTTDTPTSATTASYAGYSDPTGADGTLRAPDATITTTVEGSGAGRLELVGGVRVKLGARSEHDSVAPAAPSGAGVEPHSRGATLTFNAPGDDGTSGRVTSYEVRSAFGLNAMDTASFAAASEVLTSMAIVDPGVTQTIELTGLLPETDYTIGVRAIDNCGNPGPIVFLSFTTNQRQVGEVDACFVATAAYGSALANDVELLRRFRDAVLRRSTLGELFVEGYYTFGPPVAGVIGESDLLRATARAALAPLVERVRRLRP